MNTLKQILSEAQTVMSTTALYYTYELSNITIKAEAVALLPVTIEVDGEDANIEDVADVSIPDDFHFIVELKEQEHIFALAKSIKKEHPLFEIDQMEHENTDIYDETYQDDYLYITMPEVTTDRYDTYMDFVSTQYDETKTKLQLLKTKYNAEMIKELDKPTPNDLQTIEDKLTSIEDKAVETMDKSRQMKEDEINTAYENYLASQATSEAEAAQGSGNQKAATQMSFS